MNCEYSWLNVVKKLHERYLEPEDHEPGRSLLRGMPMCHGCGGLAGQYYFGARTGGTNLIEGTIEIALGLFFASAIAGLFSVFPTAIIGAMMLLVGIELTKFVREIHPGRELIPLVVTVAAALWANMAVGFAAGLAVHYGLIFRDGRRDSRLK